MLDKITRLLSGECLLARRPNGGGVILARSIYVSVIVYAVSLIIKSGTEPEAMLSFSFAELKRNINETIPWVGTIFAGVYAALYTRYSSQWSYLVSLGTTSLWRQKCLPPKTPTTSTAP